MPNGCHSVITISLGRLHFQILSKFTRNSPKGFFCPPSHPQDTFRLQELLYISTLLCCLWGRGSCKRAECDFTLACSQMLGKAAAEKQTFRETVRRGRRARGTHSWLMAFCEMTALAEK